MEWMDSNKVLRKINSILSHADNFDLKLYFLLKKELQTIKNEELRKYLLESLKRNTKNIKNQTTEEMIFFAINEWENIINKINNNQWLRHHEKVKLDNKIVDDETRRTLLWLWIKKLENQEIAYRWWVARIIGAILLGYSTNQIDLKTLDDVDLVAKKWEHNHKELLRTYGAASNGIWYVNDMDPCVILSRVDLSMNQVLVYKDKIYYSDDFVSFLDSWEIVVSDQWIDFYNIKSYVYKNTPICHSSVLERAFKFLIEWKAKKLKLAKYYLNTQNLNILWMQRSIIKTVRRIIWKEKDEETYIISQFYWLAWILIKIWYISTHSDIFSFINKIQENEEVIINNKFSWVEFDARRKLKKLVNLIFLFYQIEKSWWFIEYSEKVLNGFDMENNETELLKVNLPDTIEEEFIQAYHNRKNKF